MAYTLPVEVVKESVPSTFREADLRFESELWRTAMVEEIESLHVNDIWEFAYGNSQSCPKGRKPLNTNGFMQRKKDLW